jgi:hypothetical protein
MLKRLLDVTIFTGSFILIGLELTLSSTAQPLLGCWRQGWHPDANSPGAKAQSFREWCFKPRGRMESFDFACSVSDRGCDAWDGAWTYRIARGYLLLRDWDYNDRGEGHTVWRKCRMEFSVKDHMRLSECSVAGTSEWYVTHPQEPSGRRENEE